jgi:hypothetical protein
LKVTGYTLKQRRSLTPIWWQGNARHPDLGKGLNWPSAYQMISSPLRANSSANAAPLRAVLKNRGALAETLYTEPMDPMVIG